MKTSSSPATSVSQVKTSSLVPQVKTSSSPITSVSLVKTSSLVPQVKTSSSPTTSVSQVKTSSSPTSVSQVKTSSSMAGQEGESSNTNVKQTIPGLPDSLTRQCICIDDLCVFKAQHKWRIGKILQFYYEDGKTQKAHQCNQTSLNITAINKRIAVVCSWFSWHPPLSVNTFLICFTSLNYPNYCSVNEYVLTLSLNCLKSECSG